MDERRDYITVSELNVAIRNLIYDEALLNSIAVLGEVSGVSLVGPHAYFTLKDDKAQIKICFFNFTGKYVPLDGEKVVVKGCADYYVKAGQISVRCYEVEPYGTGELYRKLEKLKSKLADEGLFDKENKKEIPQYPMNIAVLTSIKGAAIQDFLFTFRRKNTVSDLTFIDVRVQGEGSADDIVTALNNADDRGYDVLVITRGGGAFEDLMPFNDENVIRTIYGMKTPVISAVGHETDFTLCDMVADYRAITPTAAAEKMAFEASAIAEMYIGYIAEMHNYIFGIYKNLIDKFVNICNLMRGNAAYLLNRQFNKIINYIIEIKNIQNIRIEQEYNKIEHVNSILDAQNPLKLLKKGYFRIVKGNEYIYSCDNLSKNDEVKILGIDGKISAVVTGKESYELRKEH